MIILVNIYAPPESEKLFFRSLFNEIAQQAEGICICGGDLNVVLNHDLDTTSHKKSKNHLTKMLNTAWDEMGLVDVWRYLHPYERDYTH